ncbi:hypothetical protein P4O66_022329 [Electrophorus voltai]|uniref:G-protein coupled receptors family 1 profile domain-containing protein n=1 Tax=Electrophorus voltai TaxID=2609070 RepID=A0AAD8ZLR8_9TELE|nr:hypothetical protein P4O66_022329 [Electrophorus voltai]
MEVNTTVIDRNLLKLRVIAQQLLAQANHSAPLLDNGTDSAPQDDLDVNTDIYSKVLVTVIYVVLFAIGCLGNSITLYTLLTKKSLQNLQSTVHYHLASLAISDLLILILSMPIELYNFIWVHYPWAFGEVVCKGYYFLRDGCSYATAFNITSLSVERYMAICHPFKAKSIMSRSRTKKLISGMWVASFLLAMPMVFTMGQRIVRGEVICTTTVSSVTAKTVLQAMAPKPMPNGEAGGPNDPTQASASRPEGGETGTKMRTDTWTDTLTSTGTDTKGDKATETDNVMGMDTVTGTGTKLHKGLLKSPEKLAGAPACPSVLDWAGVPPACGGSPITVLGGGDFFTPISGGAPATLPVSGVGTGVASFLPLRGSGTGARAPRLCALVEGDNGDAYSDNDDASLKVTWGGLLDSETPQSLTLNNTRGPPGIIQWSPPLLWEYEVGPGGLKVNAFLSFVVPMVLISALNGVIASQLLRMFREAAQDSRICIAGGNATMLSVAMEPNRAQSLRHGVMVLRAVVIAFVVCWLPYHSRRLMYCYVTEWTETLYNFYHYFYMVTNVLFYVSSAINPILYNLVSANYRQIFFSTLHYFCLPCRRKRQRHVFNRHSISICSNQTFSTNVTKETVY